MHLNLLSLKSLKICLGVVLTLVVMLVSYQKAESKIVNPNQPGIPNLSLTGGDGTNWNKTWYPDGRIWIPPVNGTQSVEFLVPVWIDNRWVNRKNSQYLVKDANGNPIGYNASPIYSFEFRVQYDSTYIRCIGYQKFHPQLDPKDERFKNQPDPLSSNFNISWFDYRDISYKTNLFSNLSDDEKNKGRAVKIVASGEFPLPVTDTASETYRVLIYLRFKVMPNTNGQSVSSPIMIAQDTIRYNDMIVTLRSPFENLFPFSDILGNDNVRISFPTPGLNNPTFVGLGGFDNRLTDMNLQEPATPGVIYLKVSDFVPNLNLNVIRGFGNPIPIQQLGTDPGYLTMMDPMTVDSTYQDPDGRILPPITADRTVKIKNDRRRSRINDLIIESDQPWLQFRTYIDPNAQYKKPSNPIPGYTRLGRINWLDNNILGTVNNPMNIATKSEGEDLDLQLQCDPSQLPNTNGGDLAGVYVGHVTFKAGYMDINPIRLRVTFIYIRQPQEPTVSSGQNTAAGPNRGIKITMTDGVTHESLDLIFGTGDRATSGVDSLFGEFEIHTPLLTNKLDARWFPTEKKYVDLIPEGFGNFAAADESSRCVSRDIRSSNDTAKSIIYLCRFNKTNLTNPIVLEWDVRDFPNGARLFLRDTSNGQLFPPTDMFNATANGFKRTYYISDPGVTSFKIEYTLPRFIDYVDEFGLPIIKKGWNLLSLPVRPMNAFWSAFYPNALNKPYKYAAGSYQETENLVPGVGYYIKFSDRVDKRFAGTVLNVISPEPSITAILDSVPLYPGWNAIGSLSNPISSQVIAFRPFDPNTNLYPLPEILYTQKYGVWGYRTDQGYYQVTEIRPGLGYWIKVGHSDPAKTNSVHAYLELIDPNAAQRLGVSDPVNQNQSILALSDMISIRDNAQHEGNVYSTSNKNLDITTFELPPVPPLGLFDVRYNNNRVLDNSDASVIRMQGVEYPLSINVNNSTNSYTFIDAVTGKVLGKIVKGSSDNLIINETAGDVIKVIKSEENNGFSFTAKPNPVENNASVMFTIAEGSNVNIRLYDALGNELTTLLNEFRSAGSYSIDMNAAGLASGRYICRINAGSYNDVINITIVK
jgi:hypothetical protein